VIIYPLLLTLVMTLFVVVLVGKKPIDVTILREQGLPYVSNDDGSMITNNIKIKLVNRTPESATFAVRISGDSGAAFVGAQNGEILIPASPRLPTTQGIAIVAPREAFVAGGGVLQITLEIGDENVSLEQTYRLIGPRGAAAN
jgi:polyferredoxin